MPRLPLGRLLHISTILMTLSLAMNVHALAKHMGQDDRSTPADGRGDTALPANSPKSEASAEQGTVPRREQETTSRGGWRSVPGLSEAVESGSSVAPVEAAFLKSDGHAAPCGIGPCLSDKGATPGDLTSTDQAQKEIVDHLLAKQGSVDEEQKKLEEQKRVLDAARIVLEERMRAIDNSMAELAEKQARHRETMAAETSRLVKIYEEMPPREAAAVFNIMDIHVLVSIANNMNPRKISAIMGYMFPERVNTVSQYLAGVRNFHNQGGTPDGSSRRSSSAGVLSWLPHTDSGKGPSLRE
ncbi:MotE family protein [Asaia spathodeae]